MVVQLQEEVESPTQSKNRNILPKNTESDEKLKVSFLGGCLSVHCVAGGRDKAPQGPKVNIAPSSSKRKEKIVFSPLL